MQRNLVPFESSKDARVLILSKRKIHNHVSRCGGYEFEDVIVQSDAVDVFTPTKPYDAAKDAFAKIKRLTRSALLADMLRPDPNPVVLEREYDLFFVICTDPWDLLSIRSVKNWRKKCRVAICYFEELWRKDLHWLKPLLGLLSEFDQVLLAYNDSVADVEQIVRRPCSYLPPAVDAIEFCPYPKRMDRCIDVFNMGRRSPITHKALMKQAEEGQLFYFYDTPQNFNVIDPKEHRRLLASMIKRSRYFFVSSAKAGQPGTGSIQSEISYRFYEGAAAGAILLGEPPETELFRQSFDWKDAVIPVPFDAPNIADLIAELDAQPDRLAQIRQDNVVNSLLRHDWVYRWEQVLKQAGLSALPQLRQRQYQLKELADLVSLNLTPKPVVEPVIESALATAPAAISEIAPALQLNKLSQAA